MRNWLSLALVLTLGVLLGFSIGRMRPIAAALSAQDGASSEGGASGRPGAAAERRRDELHLSNSAPGAVELGDIASIPFQELYGVLSNLPKAKLDELAEQLRQLPDTPATRNKLSAFYKAWAHFDAISALHAAIQLSSPEAKNNTLGSIIESTDAGQVAKLAHEINDLPAGALLRQNRGNLISHAAMKWSEVDPGGAARFFDLTQESVSSFNPATAVIARNWAALDPAAALAWAGANANGQGFSPAMQGAIAGWWQKDSVAAENYALSHVTTLGDRQILGVLTSTIYNSNPQRAIEFASRIPEKEARLQADNILSSQMAMNDPEGASTWAASLPADVRSSTLHAAISMWASSNLSAAGDWVGTLNGPARDDAVDAYTSILSRSDPGAAATLATTMADQTARGQSLGRLVTSWMEKDPTAATAWIQNSTLTNDEKRRLLAENTGG